RPEPQLGVAALGGKAGRPWDQPWGSSSPISSHLVSAARPRRRAHRSLHLKIGTALPPAERVAGNHTPSFQTLRNAVGGRRVGGRFRQYADRSRHCERRTAAWF